MARRSLNIPAAPSELGDCPSAKPLGDQKRHVNNEKHRDQNQERDAHYAPPRVGKPSSGAPLCDFTIKRCAGVPSITASHRRSYWRATGVRWSQGADVQQPTDEESAEGQRRSGPALAPKQRMISRSQIVARKWTAQDRRHTDLPRRVVPRGSV